MVEPPKSKLGGLFQKGVQKIKMFRVLHNVEGGRKPFWAEKWSHTVEEVLDCLNSEGLRFIAQGTGPKFAAGASAVLNVIDDVIAYAVEVDETQEKNLHRLVETLSMSLGEMESQSFLSAFDDLMNRARAAAQSKDWRKVEQLLDEAERIYLGGWRAKRLEKLAKGASVAGERVVMPPEWRTLDQAVRTHGVVLQAGVVSKWGKIMTLLVYKDKAVDMGAVSRMIKFNKIAKGKEEQGKGGKSVDGGLSGSSTPP